MENLADAPPAHGISAAPDPLVLVSPRHYTGWPLTAEAIAKGKTERDCEAVRYVPLSQALTLAFDYDAHFMAYAIPAEPRRLNTGAETELKDGVPMILAVFDLDDQVAKGTHVPARDEWRDEQRSRLEALRAAHPRAFVYETKGGFRVLFRLPEPIVIRSLDDAATWSARYLSWCRYLERRFELEADTTCKDWTRLYRLPRVVRESKREERAIVGDANAVGEWFPELASEDMVATDASRSTERAERPPMRAHPPEETRVLAAWNWAIHEAEPSIEGQRGDDRLYDAAKIVLRGYDLPRAKARLILDGYNQVRCKPPWPADRLEYKLDQAESESRKGYHWGYALDAKEILDMCVAGTNRPAPANDTRTAATLVADTVSAVAWVTGAELARPRPPVNWRVEGLQLAHGRPNMLTGYGFSGKTLAAQSLMLSFAAKGLAWSCFPTTGGVARHFDHEQGLDATARRYQRLARGHGIDLATLDDKLGVASFPRINLTQRDAIDAYAKLCDGVDLVTIDALRGVVPGIDENDSRIRTYIDVLSAVSERTGTTFLLIHHAGKGEGELAAARGSSAIFDGCGCILMTMTGGEPGEPKRVKQLKAPALGEGRQLEPFALKFEDVEVDGNPTGGVRVDCCERQGVTSPDEAFERLTADVLAFIAGHPGINGKGEIAQRIGRTEKGVIVAVNVLEERGHVVNRGTKQRPKLFAKDTDPGRQLVGDAD